MILSAGLDLSSHLILRDCETAVHSHLIYRKVEAQRYEATCLRS